MGTRQIVVTQSVDAATPFLLKLQGIHVPAHGVGWNKFAYL